MFHLLQQPRDPYFDEFVEIAGRDRQELYPFQQRIAFVQGLFEHPPVKSQPGFVAIEVVAGSFSGIAAMGEDLHR